MSTVMYHPETRPIPNLETIAERARSRFDEAVAIARQLADAERAWVKLGRLLAVMERDGDCKRLGFDSINEVIAEIKVLTGYGRSSMYAFKQLYEENAVNGVEVPDMPLGSGHVFKKLTPELQRDPKVIEAVKTMKPKHFKTKMATEHPECHIDDSEDLKLHLDSSFIPIFHEVIESMRVLEEDPDLSYERALELAFIAWMNESWGEPEAGITNLARARQLREMNS